VPTFSFAVSFAAVFSGGCFVSAAVGKKDDTNNAQDKAVAMCWKYI
jgi:hypothetical protein